jgi:catechol 2,3-dioxygenase-like lactoylglutathione lyase family enzyme
MKTLAAFAAFVTAMFSLSVAAEPNRSFHVPALYHVGFWVRDIAKSRQFYHDFLGFEEPYELRRATGVLQLVVMKVNERQVIYLFPDATKILPSGDNLDHLGLETDAIAAVHDHLIAQGVKIGDVGRGRIGDLLLGVKDPDGHLFEFTQFEPEGQLLKHQGESLPATRVSDHLRSATLTVADIEAARHFYCDVLGFKLVASSAAKTNAKRIAVRVADGTDYLELLGKEAASEADRVRSVPEYCLDVADVAKAAQLLSARAKSLGLLPPSAISVGDNGRRRISCIDPDGTRVVFQETVAAKSN